MKQDALHTIHLRNNFYRDNYKRVLLTLKLAFATLVLLCAALVYIVIYPPSPRYFAVTQEGTLIPLIPMNEPNLSNESILQWATQATVRAFSYNYVNYREALQGLRDDFTDQGWEDFKAALKASNNLSAVINKKLIVSAVPTGAPVIIEQGTHQGIYGWRIQIPLLVTYQSPSEISPQPLRLELLIIRLSTLQSVRGIAIHQFLTIGSGSIRN
jgi:intracellular multiplication protein IcmL